MLLLTQYSLIFASVLLLVALGGCISEHSGVINLGLEGIMVVGALGGALVMRSLAASSAVVMVLVAMIAAILAGMLYSCLLGVAAIHFKADQTLVGTAMNLMGVAAATVLVKALNTAENPNNPSATIAYGGARKSFLIAQGMEFSWLTILAVIILVLAWFVLYKTRFGLRLRSCGENPQASDSLGINVHRMRYAGTTISGALAGMGGFVYALTTANCTANGDVAGFGFLALAVMIFGNWKPLNIAGASLIFGLFKCIAATYTSIDINGDGIFSLVEIGVSPHLYRMMPYIITLLVLAFTSKKSRAPKAEGIPYDKGTR